MSSRFTPWVSAELARDARERVWKLGRPDINADLGLLKDDAAYRTATAASLGLIHSEVQQAIIEAMADGSETLAHSEATSLQLTRHQARALAARLHGIVQEFEEDPEAASAGVETQEDPSERSAAIYTGLVALAPLCRRPDAHSRQPTTGGIAPLVPSTKEPPTSGRI